MAVYGESDYIYGFHDRGGEHLLLDGQGRGKGWVLVTEELRANPNDTGGRNYKDLADRGLGVIVRLNHAYGSDGTIPHSSKYQDFSRRVANFVRNSPGAHIWVIGNEMNFEREQPRGERITPRLYATCYRLCRDAIRSLPDHQNDQVIVGAIGPWNGETPYDADPQGKYPANKVKGAPDGYPYHGFFGDWNRYLRDVCLAIGAGNCDGIAIHAYSHGYSPHLVFDDGKMGAPFNNYYYHFRTYRDQMNALPQEFRHLPVYLTEANGDQEPDGSRWPDVNSGWVKNAYKEINDWNRSGKQQIRVVILYRWSRDDAWHIDGKGNVHKDLLEAMTKNYKWNPDVGRATTTSTTADRPPYRTRYLNHTTPTTLRPGQTVEVSLTVQNVGGTTWVRDGANPFRLGFQWYNSAGQMQSFPSELDFRTPMPADVPPDGTVSLQARLRTPDTPGSYHLRWDMIHELITWFTTQGDQGLLITPVIISPTAPAVEIKPTPVPAVSVQVRDISASLPTNPAVASYPSRARSQIRRIILHHTATPATVSVERIAGYQVSNRGLPGIAYHYCLTAQGEIYQTQPLETVSSHDGNYNGESVGVCLIGDFTSAPPPDPQLEATAALLAQLVGQLGLAPEVIFGYSDLVKTGSPGATWPTWKEPLLARVRTLAAAGTTAPVSTPTTTTTPATPAGKPIEHYLLFWHQGAGNWAKWDLLGALTYVEQFPATIGFSIEEAKSARYVTIVGGPGGVAGEAEQILRAAGCQVERLAGATETETRQLLEGLAAQRQRFKTLK